MRVKFLTFALFITIISVSQAQIIKEQFRNYEVLNFDEIVRLYDDGLIELSERRIDNILKNIPDNPSADKALIFESKLDLIKGNFKIAKSKLINFINTRKNSPFIPFAYYRIGMMEFRQGSYETSAIYLRDAYNSAKKEYKIRHIEDTLDTDVRAEKEYYIVSHHSQYWQGIAESKSNQKDKALTTLQNVSSEYKDGEFADDATYAYGQLYEQKSFHEKAIAAFKNVRLEHPKSNVYIASLIREANNNLLLRKYPEASLILERADFAYNSITRDDSTGQKYEKQTHVDNPSESITYLRGEANNLAGNYKQALKYFDIFLNTFFDSKLEYECKLGAGWSNLNLGDYDQSLYYFDNIISEAPKDKWKVKSIAQLYRAVALIKSGQTEKAKEELNALSLKSDFPYLGSVLLELGQIYYKEKDFDNSKKVLERARNYSLRPVTTTRINLLLGASNMELGLYGYAVVNYDNAIKLAEKSNYIEMPKKDWYLSEARLKKGISLVMNDKSGEAIGSLSAFIAESNEKDKRQEEALFWLAEANYRSDLLQNAAQSFERLLDLFPYSDRKEDILYGLGWSYFRMQNFRKSSKVFDRLVSTFPNSRYAVEVMVRQADGYHLIKSYRKAAQLYDRVVRMSPDSDEGRYAAFQKADALYRAGSYNEAMRALETFIVKYGSSKLAPNAMYLTGWIRFQQSRYDDAVANFRFLIDRYPNSGYVPRTYYAIADSYYNQGNYEEAMKAYKTVVDKYPESQLAPEAMRSVQQCLILLGREDEAITIINDYVEKNTDSPFARGFLKDGAGIMFDNRNYSGAIDEYQKIINRDPNNPENSESLYWIGKSYVNMEEYEEAEKAFNKVVKQYPETRYAGLAILENALMQKQTANAKKADSLFSLMAEKYPEHEETPRAIFERALINFTLRDTTFGLKLYEFVADSFPGHEYADEAGYRLANYYKRLDSNDIARSKYLQLARNTRNSDIAAESFYRIGQLWKKEEQLDSAEAAYIQVKENFSGYEDWFSLSLVSLGEIYEQREEYIKAKEIYSALFELRPDDEFGDTAKARLKRVNRALREEE